MIYNTDQIKHRLTRVHELIESPTFRRDSSEDGPWKPAFTEMIIIVNDLLVHMQQVGKRVDFYEGVGSHGKIQDITSLVEWVRDCFPGSITDSTVRSAYPRLNRYFDQGTGYFANGTFFTGEYDAELAFFVDDQRIYLNHHIRRAIDEAEQKI